jgi:glutamyl-Q tRNA(Asp) synthetase
VRAADGQKLSKQTGAAGLIVGGEADAVRLLLESAAFLRLPVESARSLEEFWGKAALAWGLRIGSA